ncbi:MAG: hypothetical protein WCE62_16215, partial [Polyangiales bacterium]
AKPEPPPPPPAPVAKPTPAPEAPVNAAPNPDWADEAPDQYEARSPNNPDWVDETKAPPLPPRTRSASAHYGLRYANRNLTMPRGMMRGTFDTDVGRRVEGAQGVDDEPFGPTGTIGTMNFGVAMSLADGFEVGFSRYRMGSFPGVNVFPGFGFGDEGLAAFSISPDVKFGDIPLYARVQVFESDVVKVGVDAVFRIPVRTVFGFLGGLPLRFIVDERFAFDTGLQFTVDSNPQGPSIWSINFPFNFIANATERFFLKLNSGMNLFDLGGTVSAATSGLVQGPFYLIPLGFGAGYTVDPRSTMMDVFAIFEFPALYGFTSRASQVTTETWQVIIGLNVYSPVLFKGRAVR